MHTRIQYCGDANLVVLMSAVGVQKSLPEIKAYLMRINWGTRSRLPVEVMDDLLGPERENISKVQEFELFREQILALWNELARHRSGEIPFSFHQFAPATCPEDLVIRVKCRVKEAQMLMPLFAEDFITADVAEEATAIKEHVIASLQKLAIVLDALNSGEALTDLPQAEKVLQMIDRELESQFNKLGHLSLQCIKPTHNQTFTVIGNRGEA